MALNTNSSHFDNFFDVSLEMETYFSLSLPIPQSVLSRDQEINYWKDYINGQYHDLNMVFGLEIDDGACYENQAQRLALEFEMRGKKYAAISGIIQSLSNIKSFPPVGLELEMLRLAYKTWDDLELKIIELLIENPAPRRQSLGSNISSSPEYGDDFNFVDLNLPQKYTTCSPMESKSEPCPRSTTSLSDYPTPDTTPNQTHHNRNSPPFSNINGKFECPYTNCSQSFPRQNALLRHFASIHDDAVCVVCPFCPKGHKDGKTFNRSDNFQRHVIKQHPEIRKDDLSVKEALERLWRAGGVRTSWGKKGVAKKGSGRKRR